MELTLPPDFRESIASCVAHDVRFLIVVCVTPPA